MRSGLGAVVTYAVLTVLWGLIVVLYARHRKAAASDPVIRTLLAVLLLDALKSVMESAYFGLVWGANYGLLSDGFKVLGRPEFLTAVKLLNVAVAVVVLVLLIGRWFPGELHRRAQHRIAEATLRLELEASLDAARASEERFSLATHATRDAVWDWDLRTGVVITSPRMAEMLGYAAADWESTPAPWVRVLHPDDAAPVNKHIKDFIRGREASSELRYRATHRDGHLVHLHATATLVRSAAGRALRLVGFARDVSNEVAAEIGRVQAQKLESLGLLAGGVAHDFNNVLTVLSSSLALAEREAGPGTVQETLATATLAVQRAALITRQLLTYSGQGSALPHPNDLNLVIEAMGALLRVPVGKNVTLNQTLATGLPLVRADEAQLQQLVMNLITNAAEAARESGGTVTLTTRAQTLTHQPASVIGQAPLGPCVVLQVTDTGSGMTAAVRARIFDPFFSTKGIGRGLGLSAIAGIVKGHGGALALDSTPGRGTTFTVYLPALAAEATTPAAAPTNGAPAPLTARVLLVDDEPLLRRSARRLLQLLGCTVEEATNGLEAVDKVRSSPAAYDVVLMDVTMPEMDGMEAARQLLALAPSLPIVLSSGYAAAELGDQLPAGVRTLAKPYTGERLELVLREATGR